MTPFLRGMDRFVTALLALLLLGGSAWVIAYKADVTFARDAATRIDPEAIGRAPDWPGWSWSLGAAGGVVVILGAWLLLLHLRPRSVRAVDTEHVGAVDLARLADAAAEDLGRHPAVQSAKAVTRTAGGRPVVRITVEIPSTTTPADVRRLAYHCHDDVRRAADADIEFQLLAEPLPADKVSPQLI